VIYLNLAIMQVPGINDMGVTIQIPDLFFLHRIR